MCRRGRWRRTCERASATSTGTAGENWAYSRSLRRAVARVADDLVVAADLAGAAGRPAAGSLLWAVPAAGAPASFSGDGRADRAGAGRAGGAGRLAGAE